MRMLDILVVKVWLVVGGVERLVVDKERKIFILVAIFPPNLSRELFLNLNRGLFLIIGN